MEAIKTILRVAVSILLTYALLTLSSCNSSATAEQDYAEGVGVAVSDGSNGLSEIIENDIICRANNKNIEDSRSDARKGAPKTLKAVEMDSNELSDRVTANL
jgi:hypothetical protein